jgi:hypothetical protein
VLEVGRNARVDATIELGAVSETVSVVGDSPLVDTTSAALTRTVGQNEVLNLPLVNRDLYQLLSITGGVTSNTSSNSLGGPEQVTMINGSGRARWAPSTSSWMAATTPPACAAPATRRRTRSGAGVPRADQRLLGGVRPLLRGRRRHRHQVGHERLSRRCLRFHPQREAELAALGAAGTVGTNDPLDRKQFGGAFGGPLAKDKTFFFASYSGLRQEETYYRNTAVVPTALERAGDFSLSTLKPRDPLTDNLFPAASSPRHASTRRRRRFRTNTSRCPTCPTTSSKSAGPDPVRTDEATLKLDHQISSAQSLALSYFYQNGTDTQPLTLTGNIPWVDRDFKWKQHNLNLSHTWTLSPTTINQLRGTYMRQFGGRVNNPTTSLGDLNSKFTPQGDPTLPRSRSPATSPARPRSPGRTPAATTRRQGRAEHHQGQALAQDRRRLLVRSDRPRHAARQLRRLHLQRQQDRQRLRRLPARPAATMTQDAPVRKTDNGAYISAFAQDDFRDPSARHVEPRRPLRSAVPVHRSAGSQARVRARAEVDDQPDGAGRPAVPGDTGVSRGIVQTDVNNIAPRSASRGIRGRRPHRRCAPRSACSTAASPATSGTPPADNQPFTVPTDVPRRCSRCRSAIAICGRSGSRSRSLHVPGRLASPCRRRCSDPRSTSSGRSRIRPTSRSSGSSGRSFSVTGVYVGSFARHLAAAFDNNYPSMALAPPPRTSTPGGRICPARSAAAPCCLDLRPATTTDCR